MDDNPFDNLDSPSPTQAKTNPFDNLGASPKAQSNPFEDLGSTASQGRGMPNFPALGGAPPNAPGVPEGLNASAGWYDRLSGKAREVVGEAGPAMKGVGDYLFSKLPSLEDVKSPDYVSNKLGEGVQAVESGTEAVTKFLLTEPSKALGLPEIPSSDLLVKDIGAYLFEGGNLTEVSGVRKPSAMDMTKTELAPNFFAQRGAAHLDFQDETPEFSSRLQRIVQDAEHATGDQVRFTSLARSHEKQAELYYNYTHHIGGQGLAAPPGMSLHERGMAADLADGPALDWIRAHAHEYGLEHLGMNDKGHIQMGGAPPMLRSRGTHANDNIAIKGDVLSGESVPPEDLGYRSSIIKEQQRKLALEDPKDTYGHIEDLNAEDAIIQEKLNPEDIKPVVSPNGITPAEGVARSASAASTPVGMLAEHNIAQFEAQNKSPGFKQQLRNSTNYIRDFMSAGETGKSIIQKNLGRETRIGAQATHAMQQFKAFTNDLNMDEQLGLLKWLQDPQSKLSQGLQLSPEAKNFVDTFKDWMDSYKNKLQSLPQTQQMNFRNNFVSQLWRRPNDAMAYINQYGAKRGSNYFTKARVFDDYEAGIRAGFAPVTTNPMEIFSRYIENATHKIAWWESVNDARNSGMVVYRDLQNAPQGWVEMKSMEPVFGQHAFAPPGLARIFDNYASRAKQINIPGTQVDLLNAAQRASNTATAFKLAISGFHPALESMEGVLSGMANGITKMKNGRPIAGLAEFLTASRKPFTSIKRGRYIQKAFLDSNVGSPEMQRIIQGLTDANYDFMREGGLSDEYRVSRLPGFFKGWGKGIPMTAGGPFRMGIRAFETTMEPVFQYYVPWLKNQAAYDAMKTYLDANPSISPEDFATYGRKVSNMIDARFGEMNKNNIFWDATSKKMAQTAMISWSFTLGQARQALGAGWDAARIPSKLYNKAKGNLPKTEEIWTDRLSYALAIGLGTAMVNSVYQYLKTGQLPADTRDILHPRTGGIDPTTKKPERAVLPNFANSYMNIWNNGIGKEAYAKMAPLWQTLTEAATNKDWKDQLIRDPNDTVPAQLMQTAKFAVSNAITPITFGTIGSAKPGTNIGPIERAFGLRPAGMQYTNPEQVKQIISYKAAEAWYAKRKTDINQQRSMKGQGPIRIPYKVKQHLIEQYMKNPQVDPLNKFGGAVD